MTKDEIVAAKLATPEGKAALRQSIQEAGAKAADRFPPGSVGEAVGRTLAGMPPEPAVYCTSFCNSGHRMSDGKPVGHECVVLPVRALRAERAGDIDQALTVLSDGAPFKPHRGVKP